MPFQVGDFTLFVLNLWIYVQQVSYLLRRTGRAGLVNYMLGGEVLDRNSSWFGIAIVVLYASNKSIQATCTCLLRSLVLNLSNLCTW